MLVTYRQAGVDVEAADRLLGRLAPLIRSTHGPEVLPDLGQFAGLFRLPGRQFREPVLVSSTDGVGTKLMIARQVTDYTAIGMDVVAMNTNDVLVYGAQPLFFLDYVAMGRLDPRLFQALLRGIVQGCRASGCALIGGETAEMPGLYDDNEYDVAGFCVGVVERRRLIDGAHVRAGDVVIGLASSGVHANGFSLVRRVFSRAELARLRTTLLTPTRIYVKSIMTVLRRYPLTAIAHVTGGGVARRLPSLVSRRAGLTVRWMPGRWPVPRIFERIQEAGRIDPDDMYATFNMGIGMVVACRPAQAPAVLKLLSRVRVPAWTIGMIERAPQHVKD